MHALDWLGDIAQWLLALIPRVVLVRRTHGAVRFTRDHVKELKAGIHLYWPVWSEVQQICVVRQTLNLSYQCLMSKDKETVVVAAIVVFRITDAAAALTTTDNIQDTIHDVAMAAIRRVVSSCDFDEIHANTSKGKSIDSLLRRRLQSELSTYGVAVDRAFLSEICQPVIVRLLSDFSSN